MRIACIHIPQYALQCATRVDPSLRGPAGGVGAAIAVVDAGEVAEPALRVAAGSGSSHPPAVVACSRAAWALGVRLGMTAVAARSVSLARGSALSVSSSPEVAVVAVDVASERETVRAVADALLGLTPVVDVGGRVGSGGAHLAMYAEVPQKMRGHSFGERVVEQLAELGLTGRIGIADDRFTAWVAAAYGADAPGQATEARARDHGAVTVVPRGGSSAFLAPRPLSLLAISPEVQHMLEALGVRTLGEFAALPAPSIARPLDADYRALARGESGAHLRPYAPEAAIREEIVVSAGNVLDAEGAVSGPTAIAIVAKRIAMRLGGRGRAAARVELVATTDAGSHTVIPDLAAIAELGVAGSAARMRSDLPGHVEPRATPAIASGEELARAFAPVLEVTSEATVWRLRATVVGEAVTVMNEHQVAVTSEQVMPGRAVERAASMPVVVRGVSVGASVAVAASGSGSGSGSTVGSGAGAFGSRRAGERRPGPADAAGAHPRVANTNEHAPAPIASCVDLAALPSSASAVSDPLAVVLSTSGALFALGQAHPIHAGREHRRTRRGKQRRSRSMNAPVQARLFDRR